ncbi:MAG: hypothetical protein E7016_04935 [Alphaproteobacteria bacterium]|nr:hypothetical protein [Alphaproteobacteria bacterium]
MRKYFLLSAVAILAATNVNATTDYAEVTARATIEMANEVTCSEFNFGTFVIKKGNGEISFDSSQIGMDELSHLSGDINSLISHSGYTSAVCSLSDMDNAIIDGATTSTNYVTLKGKKSSKTLNAELKSGGYMPGSSDGVYFSGILTIPEDIEADEYTGSFTINFTY